MVLRKSLYIRWSAGRSPRVREVNPGRDPSITLANASCTCVCEYIHIYESLLYPFGKPLF